MTAGVVEGLRSRRERLRLTQAELAAAAGVASKTVQRAERGGAISDDSARRIGEALRSAGGVRSTASVPPGRRFRERRRARGLTLEELGRCLSVSAAQLSRFERGLGVPVCWRDPGSRKVTEFHARDVADALGYMRVEQLNEMLFDYLD